MVANENPDSLRVTLIFGANFAIYSLVSFKGKELIRRKILLLTNSFDFKRKFGWVVSKKVEMGDSLGRRRFEILMTKKSRDQRVTHDKTLRIREGNLYNFWNANFFFFLCLKYCICHDFFNLLFQFFRSHMRVVFTYDTHTHKLLFCNVPLDTFPTCN